MTKRRYLLISVVPLAALLLVLALSPGAGVPQVAVAGPNVVPGRYIVMLKDGVDAHVAAADVNELNGVHADTVYTSAFHGFAAEMTGAQALALARDPSVSFVEPVQRMSIDLHINNFQTLPSGIDRIDADENATASISGSPGSNLNIDVAVIDTGVDTQHPDLNVAGGAGFTDDFCNNPSYEDDNGHGTHVSGTMAAIDDNRGVVGVAPGARIWGVKVLDSSGSGTNDCVIAGVDWVTNRRAEYNDGAGDGDPGINIRVANMSLGGGNDFLLCQAIANSTAAGVIYAVAAGNSHVDAGSTSPANCTSAVTVSAFGDFDGRPGALSNAYFTFSSCPPNNQTVTDDRFACFSNYGAVVDIAAPGVDIISTYPATASCGGAHCYATMGGTSMASPHVAGALALFVLATGYNASAMGPAVMTAFTASGYTRLQSSVCGFTGDPDAFPEPVLYVGNSCGLVTTPTPSPTPSPSPTPTHSPTPTPSPTSSPTPTQSPTPTPSPTPFVTLTPSPTPTQSPTPAPTNSPSTTPSAAPAPIQGDANCDNHVTSSDALQILLALGDLSSSSACVGAPDVNCNGHIDGQDVVIILQYLSGHATSVAHCPHVGSHV